MAAGWAVDEGGFFTFVVNTLCEAIGWFMIDIRFGKFVNFTTLPAFIGVHSDTSVFVIFTAYEVTDICVTFWAMNFGGMFFVIVTLIILLLVWAIIFVVVFF